MSHQATTQGGTSRYRNINLGVTGQVIKANPGQVYGYYLFNNAATARYVKFYNKATAPVETDTPELTIELPAAGGANLSFPTGDEYSAGISLRGTTGVADADVGAPSSNDIIVAIWYK